MQSGVDQAAQLLPRRSAFTSALDLDQAIALPWRISFCHPE